MATMNISLPGSLRQWVEIQIAGGRYANNSDYVRDLIRKDQEYQEKLTALQQAVTIGVNSGEPSPLNMTEIKQLAKEQAA